MSVGLDILLLPIIEVVLMGLLAGLVGVVALVHRRIFFTESLTHATFPGAIIGVVLAAWFSQAILGQRADFTLLSTLVLVGISYHFKKNSRGINMKINLSQGGLLPGRIRPQRQPR